MNITKTINSFGKFFDKVGGGMDASISKQIELVNTAQKYGLNTGQFLTTVASKLDLLTKYGFPKGVNDLASMVAKSQVLALSDAGYRPALPTLIPVTGRYGLATIMGQLLNMRDGGFISAHDYKIASMIAEIVSGGDVDAGSLVSEQWLLDMERKAFMELLNHPKTQERIMGMLQTGKPVRN